MSRLGGAGLGVVAGVLCALLAGEARAKNAQPAGGKEKAAAPKKDEQALAALKEMGTTLGSAKTLQFKARGLRPFKTASGEWVTLVTTANVMREGADKLHVETGGDAFAFDLFYDGKTVTAFAAKEKIYAQQDAPATIDAALDQAAKNGNFTIAFGDLVSTDPYAGMTKGMKAAHVVGTSTISGVEVEHLAVQGEKLNWEIWIGTKDHLPRLATVTDLSDAHKPTHTMEFTDWAVDQTLPANAFTFNAPADAVKVPFRQPGQPSAMGRSAPRPKH
jgi:hypothetical protein